MLKSMKKHPLMTLAVALGVGMLVVYIVKNRRSEGMYLGIDNKCAASIRKYDVRRGTYGKGGAPPFKPKECESTFKKGGGKALTYRMKSWQVAMGKDDNGNDKLKWEKVSEDSGLAKINWLQFVPARDTSTHRIKFGTDKKQWFVFPHRRPISLKYIGGRTLLNCKRSCITSRLNKGDENGCKRISVKRLTSSKKQGRGDDELNARVACFFDTKHGYGNYVEDDMFTTYGNVNE